ncbi:DNA-directed DNA polymerase II small subunit [archaeon]|nr:DNA-directed DNA polymerase II small subunit [archaeon]
MNENGAMQIEKQESQLQAVVSILAQNNYFLTPSILKEIKQGFNLDSFLEFAANTLQKSDQPLFLASEIISQFKIKDKQEQELNQQEEQREYAVKIINSFNEKTKKRKIEDFVDYFRTRYTQIKDMLQLHTELHDAISISKAKLKKEKVVIIGLVNEISFSKIGNCRLVVEDLSGEIQVIVQKNTELFRKTKSLVFDEVIGITGSVGEGGLLFAHDISFPDVPLKELKKSPDEAYVVFTADFHIGSNLFHEKEFENFISWLNCESGDQNQREIASKVKYLFIVGDLVDGIGIYPEQEKELTIKDIDEQYARCEEYIKKIREDINIIICGGNHDALRLSEPQPPLDKSRFKEIYNFKNIIFVSNPAFINIHASETFSGFDILMYHGYSLDYYTEAIESIRYSGRHISERSDLIMQCLLQKRHLAPAHTSTLYIPSPSKDSLVIEKVPDIFVTAHMHKPLVSSYKNITLLSCSCWQGKTVFQEKVGHEPDPDRVLILNLKTRQIKNLKFSSE